MLDAVVAGPGAPVSQSTPSLPRLRDVLSRACASVVIVAVRAPSCYCATGDSESEYSCLSILVCVAGMVQAVPPGLDRVYASAADRDRAVAERDEAVAECERLTAELVRVRVYSSRGY